ncbi:MAG: hypothetical protein KAR06_06275, partial [Deltaproteobacteria bacterium]|nr:hypothetical protein [Deltaproteobacteria bacterium]
DVVTNWQEGTSEPVASMAWNGRYHLCVMQSSTTLTNDRCWVFQKNEKWTHFDGPSYASLTIFDNEPLAGTGASDGKIFKIMRDNVWRDDESSIDSYWETADFTMDAPGQDKKFTEMWIDAAYQSGSKLDVGYAMNKTSVFTSTNTALDSTENYINKRIESFPADGFAAGRYLRIRFGRNSIDEYYRLNTATIYYDIEPLNPD